MARVLIADDASFMRQMIREIIEPEGHEVVGEATNGIEAVDLYNELTPDLVTMDIVMPKRSGIDAAKAIASTLGGIDEETLPKSRITSRRPTTADRGKPLAMAIP